MYIYKYFNNGEQYYDYLYFNVVTTTAFFCMRPHPTRSDEHSSFLHMLHPQ